MDQLHEKYERLKDCLRGLGGVAVAFSGIQLFKLCSFFFGSIFFF